MKSILLLTLLELLFKRLIYDRFYNLTYQSSHNSKVIKTNK